jgi:nucleoside-diphosphate-sugar epimerase
MKIFLAGATGAIGRMLIPLLLEAGHEVVGATREQAKVAALEGLGARPIVVDAFDREGLFRGLRIHEPEVVIHQLTDLGKQDFAANTQLRIEGTRNLVDAARAVGVRRMVAQSIAFVYAPGTGPAREEDPLDLEAPPPRGNTALGVQALERAVTGLPEGIVLRYGMLYGRGTGYAAEGRVAEEVRLGQRAATAGVVSFLHVEDAARAAVSALAWPPGPVNLVDDEPSPGTEWLPVFAAAVGAPPPPVRSGSERGARGAANAKAHRLLG